MISLADVVIIMLVGVGVMLSRPPYKLRSWLLLAEFSVFIGFAVLIGVNDLEDKMWIDPSFAAISVAFMFGFTLLNSRYLASVSALIAFYYIWVFTLNALSTYAVGWVGQYNLMVDYDYGVMLILSLLQLIGLIPGVYHGILRHIHRKTTDGSGHSAGRTGPMEIHRSHLGS